MSRASAQNGVKKRKTSGRGEEGKSEVLSRAQVLAASRIVEVSEIKKYAGQDIL